jgi:hypothetical protein
MPLRSAPPQPGQIVTVRMRKWLVEAIDRRRGDDDCTQVSLACLDDDAQGEQLTILWEKELDPQIQLEEGWRHLGEKGFDDPRPPTRRSGKPLNRRPLPAPPRSRGAAARATPPRAFSTGRSR